MMKIGDKCLGTITGIKPYGAFVQLADESIGLIHISEIKTGYIDNIYKELSVGDRVPVQVIDLDDYSQKISLSMRTLEEEKHHYPYRQRFSNTRLKIGFAPLAKQMPIWIKDSKDYLQSKE